MSFRSFAKFSNSYLSSESAYFVLGRAQRLSGSYLGTQASSSLKLYSGSNCPKWRTTIQPWTQ